MGKRLDGSKSIRDFEDFARGTPFLTSFDGWAATANIEYRNGTQPFWMEGNFAPVSKEETRTDLKVTGEIPKDLNGRYFRNGANPRVTASKDWFLGEGMIHGVEIQNGKANWYKNRYVQTPLLKEDVISREISSLPGNSYANTHIVDHGGKVLALQEMHAPYELTKDMETVGSYDFDGKLARNMTAHPKICPKLERCYFSAMA